MGASHPTTPTIPHLNMSTERELTGKFKEAIETKDINSVYPYLAEDMTYEILPSSFVVVQVGSTS